MIETLNSLAFRATGMDISPSNAGGISLENPRNSLARVFDIQSTYTGKAVTESSALTIAAVWACVRIISGTIAKTPLNTFRRTPDGKQLAPGHYLFNLLRNSANERMTAFRFQRLMMAWVLLWGNAYAEMEINGRGQITALWPMRPDRMRIIQAEDGTLTYIYQPVGVGLQTRVIDSHYMFHLRGLELDGVVGLSPIQQARQSIGLAMAAEEYGARFFGNNGRPGMVLQHPGVLSDKAQKNLLESWNSIHQGLQGAHRVGVLEEGMELKEVGIPPEDAQFLQTRRFQAVDIARIFGVPPHKIAELDKATFSNIENQSIEFVQDSMEDWFGNWEAEIPHSMLSAREASTIFAQFDRRILLRGDFASRSAGLATLRQNGFINGDEGREDLGFNPIPDGSGKKYVIQLNMQDLDKVGEEPEPDPADPNEPAEPAEPAKPAAKPIKDKKK